MFKDIDKEKEIKFGIILESNVENGIIFGKSSSGVNNGSVIIDEFEFNDKPTVCLYVEGNCDDKEQEGWVDKEQGGWVE